MSIISGLQTYFEGCTLLDVFTGGSHVDWTDNNPANYGIMPNGDTVTKKFVNGKTMHQYNFAIYFCKGTLGDFAKLQNSEFMEDFADWVCERNLNGELPTLGQNKVAEELTADNGILFDYNEIADSGTYQIQLHLKYRKI